MTNNKAGKAKSVYNRKFTSGICWGGVSRSNNSINEEKQYCKQIMKSPTSLRVWLSIRQQVDLADSKYEDLHAYMKILWMCPSDPEFPSTLALFAPENHEDTLYERLVSFLLEAMDFVSSNFAVIGTIVTILSPLLIPLLGWILGYLFSYIPLLERMLDPVLPKEIKEERKKKKKGSSADPTLVGDAIGDAATTQGDSSECQGRGSTVVASETVSNSTCNSTATGGGNSK